MSDSVTIRLPIFRPGQDVEYQGESARVDHVLVRRGGLMVYLEGRPVPIDSDEINVAPTEFVYRRRG